MRNLTIEELIDYTNLCFLCKNSNDFIVHETVNKSIYLKTLNKLEIDKCFLKNDKWFNLSVICKKCFSQIHSSFSYYDFQQNEIKINSQSIFLDDLNTNILFHYDINTIRIFKNPDIFYIDNYNLRFGDYANYINMDKLKNIIKIYTTFK